QAATTAVGLRSTDGRGWLSPHSIFSVRGRGTDFFNNYSDANGCGLFDLDQRIGDVDVGDKDGAAESARGIDGIGGRGIDRVEVMARSSDSDARRVGVDLNDLLSGGKVSGYARTDLDVTGWSGVE